MRGQKYRGETGDEEVRGGRRKGGRKGRQEGVLQLCVLQIADANHPFFLIPQQTQKFDCSFSF